MCTFSALVDTIHPDACRALRRQIADGIMSLRRDSVLRLLILNTLAASMQEAAMCAALHASVHGLPSNLFTL